MTTPWPNHSRLRRFARAGDRFCAAAVPHLQMAIFYLAAVLLMQALVGPTHFIIP
jgi:hypothetical protein